MSALTFTVVGKSEPQGSSRAFMPRGSRYPVVTSDNPKLKAWRKTVAIEARRAMDGQALLSDVPVRVCAGFYLPRPKALKKNRPHVTRPDSDKLARALLDSLTGVVYRDDGQVVELKVIKAYAALGDPPHVVISVMPLPAVEGGLFR